MRKMLIGICVVALSLMAGQADRTVPAGARERSDPVARMESHTRLADARSYTHCHNLPRRTYCHAGEKLPKNWPPNTDTPGSNSRTDETREQPAAGAPAPAGEDELK